MDKDAKSQLSEAYAEETDKLDAFDDEVARVQLVRYRPGRWFWWCLPFAFAGAVAVAYQLGSVGSSVQSPAERLTAMQDEFELDRVEELRAELTQLRLSQTADVGANNEVRASFRELQSQIAALEEEVSFYRSLMAPEELAKGLRIEKMLLRPTERPGVYGYELVIAQTVARHTWQEGELYFEVHGAIAGERAVLALTEIATIPEYPLSFKFRYFQNYAGEFALPDTFTPESVIVTLDRGSEGEIVQQRYDWLVKGADLAQNQ